MLRSHYRSSHRIPYGLHRSHQMRPGLIRYPRSRLLYRQMMMSRPRFYPPSAPPKEHGFFYSMFDMVVELFCSSNQKPGVSPLTSGGSGATSGGGGATSGGGGGGSCGGGGCGGGCGGD